MNRYNFKGPVQTPQSVVRPDDALRQLQSDPSATLRQAGFSVPPEYMKNGQTAAMYIIQSGQAGGPAMQRIQQFLSRFSGR